MGDTIFAIASPPGRGGIGIVRVSGPETKSIALQLLGEIPRPRHAKFAGFRDEHGDLIDSGIALFFEAPASYTGEDVLELHGHGSPVALQRLSECLARTTARIANPGEFTQRAFLNNKLDLAQAEAVADLIASSSEESARAAVRSLSGAFSKAVRALDQATLQIRVFVESAIDFAEEEIDFLSDQEQLQRLRTIVSDLKTLIERSSQGMVMQLGIELTIAGEPNVGKSSLLNALLEQNRAIVTPIAGTTRDTVEGEIVLDGLPVKLTDTAGIRQSADPVEAIGVARAQDAIEKAHGVLWVIDDTASLKQIPTDVQSERTILVRNKCDLSGLPPGTVAERDYRISALTEQGIDLLREGIKRLAGFSGGEDAFAGRPRHLDALRRAQTSLHIAEKEMQAGQGELVAENLRHVHACLGEIVGFTTTDDLLGEIFSTFCIGK